MSGAFRLAALAIVALACAMAPMDVYAEDAWCGVCRDWVVRDATHNGNTCAACHTAVFCQDCGGIYVSVDACPHKDKQCEVCGGWYKGRGAHDGCPMLKCGKCGKSFDKPVDGMLPVLCPDCSDPDVPMLKCSRCGSFFEKLADGTEPLLCPDCAALPPWRLFVEKHAVVFGLGAFAFVLALVVLFAVRSARRAAAMFVFVKGKPQGIELVPDELVCSDRSLDSGGTAEGRPAMVRRDGKWIPAFVKRIIGGGMREETRRPALEFEANILKRLAGTGIAPELLIDVTDSVAPGGENWTYFTMTVAEGVQWPQYGGFGSETRHALYALCEALIALQDKGIGHHDLKPMNIFYHQKSRRVTLLDFGSAIDHSGVLVNPLGNTYPKTMPWVAPDSDGSRLAELSPKSDAFVYGLIFCEAVLGCIHSPTLAARKSAASGEDREWMREKLAEKFSPQLADAVIDGLLAIDVAHRMGMAEFHSLLASEWEGSL